MKLSDKTRRKIVELREELESIAGSHHDGSTTTYCYDDLELDAFLKFHKSIPSAAKALLNARQWKQENPVSIANVAPFYRTPPSTGGSKTKLPPAFLVCLEDGQGSVARDTEGRPIIWMMGIIYGTKHELQQQLVYALQRASHYRLPHHHPDEVCFITEVMSRDKFNYNPLRLGMCHTFRFPDAAVRSLLDFMRTTFPGSQYSVLHFCGLPSVITGTFQMIKPFVSTEAFNRLNLQSNFGYLKRDGHVDPKYLLPEWDKEGTFHFDLDAYVEWRAKEEGIAVNQLPPRGGGRSYELQTNNNPDDFGLSTLALLGTPESLQNNVIKMGWMEKRGSGMGLFATNRWKSKYMVLTPGCLFYFGSSKISASNVASRMISLDGGETCSVCQLLDNNEQEGNDDKKAQILLHAEGRDYIFGFSNDKDAQEWLVALQRQCQTTVEDDDDDADVSSTSTSEEPVVINPASVSILLVGAF